jgi:hypothetical protein
MNDEPPRKKGFLELLFGAQGQQLIASIMALTLCSTLLVIAIMSGAALLQRNYELNGSITGLFEVVLGAIAGSLGTYLGLRKNGNGNN